MTKIKKMVLASILLIGIGMATPVSAGHSIRIGSNFPLGLKGEYEYKMMLGQLGLFGALSSINGDANVNGKTVKVDMSAYSIGARLYLPLGFHIKGGYTSLTAKGKSTVNTAQVDTEAKAAGLDVGLGYEIGLGPLFLGIEGSLLLAKPDISTSVAGTSTGGITEAFGNLNAVPNIGAVLGLRF